MLTELKREAYEANIALPQQGLINLTFGNASAIDRRKGIFAIKPSGVAYDKLSPSDMVLVDLAGKKVEGDLKPSSDAPTHRRLYTGFKKIGGVVHTHSTYATAWAARGEEIPCVITAMADEFGGPIPIGDFAIIGDDTIGRGIVEALTGHRSRAVLMQNHGPFTIGKDARDAVKAAVMVEDVARTVHIARQGGELIPIPQAAIDSLFNRYQNVYGQAPQGALK